MVPSTGVRNNIRCNFWCMPVVLSIAGSDSIGGAGVQADIKALSSLGVHATTVITCVTSQNTTKVSAIFPLPVEHVLSQLEAVLTDAKISSIKMGMLYSQEIASAVAARLRPERLPLVVDPVLAAGVGDSLHTHGLLRTLKEEVFPLAWIITPNRYEAEALLGKKIRNLTEARRACHSLMEMGPRSVLLKGGHFTGKKVVDLLCIEGEIKEIKATRLEVRPHGSGCNLSSYIAGHLALGLGLEEAVVASRALIQDALSAAYSVGQGLKVLDSLSSLKREALRYQTLVQLKEGVDALIPKLERRWIPEVGMNFAYALPRARYIEDVVAIEGRIVASGDKARRCGCLAFGASRHMAKVVLAAMSYDPCMRSALNLRYSKENLNRLKELGLTSSAFDRSEEPDGVSTMDWGTRKAIESHGAIPDIIYDLGGIGKEPMIRILGRDPMDVIDKISGIWLR
ncbi:MAG: bifunctional hydroxymethylpyrimidine kinase/phosphomethylpyrimidine kinase [Methanomassiliicoccales archaeon]